MDVLLNTDLILNTNNTNFTNVVVCSMRKPYS